MTLRLGDLVLRGELFNTSPYTVHGWLMLRGWDKPMMLHLTGDCDADLQGRHIRFVSRRDPTPSDSRFGEEGSEVDLSHVAWQQIGPTGTITASRKVKIADCPPVELCRRIELGEPPPMRWVRCLYLEWFSQNGRVLVELPDPELEFIAPDEDPNEADGFAGSAAGGDDDATTGLGITSVQLDDDGQADIQHHVEPDDWFDEEPVDEAEDPYGLIPDTLKQQFDADAMEVDRIIDEDSEGARSMREMELMDELIERGEGEPIGTLFEKTVRLPRPDEVSDADVEGVLKSLLAELALFGIALEVCEHFTPRDAYRLLVEEICKEQHAYRELQHTQWVQHFMTSEFCEKCEAQLEREMEESDRRRNPDPPGDESTRDDGLPF